MQQSHMATSKQSPTVRLNLSPAEYRALKVWCASEGITISALLTNYCRAALARHSTIINDDLVSAGDLRIPRMTPLERMTHDALETLGYTVVRAGWPDFGASKDGRIVFVEVKSSNKVQPHQAQTMKWLASLGHECFVLYPDGKNRGLWQLKDEKFIKVEEATLGLKDKDFQPDGNSTD